MSEDRLYFSASEVMKGIRLLWNEMNYEMFYGHFFSGEHHTEEYAMSMFKKFGDSPFHFWCMIDDDKRQTLEFLIDDCTNRELIREKEVRSND